MTEKELRRLNRSDLLEILIEQGKKIELLERRLAKANKELENRRIVISNAGSIAEAALQLNGVFQAAEAAAKQYLESIESMRSEQ